MECRFGMDLAPHPDTITLSTVNQSHLALCLCCIFCRFSIIASREQHALWSLPQALSFVRAIVTKRSLTNCRENWANKMLPITSLPFSLPPAPSIDEVLRVCIELIFYCIISDVLAYSFSGVSGTFPALDLARFSRSFLSGSSWVPVPTYLPSPLCEFESAGESKESARNRV
eukprot:scaffold1389_cov176-Skeletonema_marinoi.AAC.2